MGIKGFAEEAGPALLAFPSQFVELQHVSFQMAIQLRPDGISRR
jgi:hypothetical protein